MNLHSEVILSLALTSLIGLWLIWQALKINSNIDIFQIVVNWFRDRPIILPSLFFLMSPFAFAYIFHNLPPDFNQIFDNKILAQLLTTFGTVISIYIGNRALESFRKIQGEKKVAKIIIVSMESQLDNLEEILKYLIEYLSESLMQRIDNKVNQIRKNYIYESALKEVGILRSKHIDIISKSSIALNSILDEIPRVYDMQQKFQDENSKRYVTLGIKKIVINIKLDIMVLSREILQDNERFNTYRKILKDKYSQIKVHIDNPNIFDDPEQIEMNYHYYDDPKETKKILGRIETLFDEYSLLTELNDSYNKRKIELDALRLDQELG